MKHLTYLTFLLLTLLTGCEETVGAGLTDTGDLKDSTAVSIEYTTPDSLVSSLEQKLLFKLVDANTNNTVARVYGYFDTNVVDINPVNKYVETIVIDTNVQLTWQSQKSLSTTLPSAWDIASLDEYQRFEILDSLCTNCIGDYGSTYRSNIVSLDKDFVLEINFNSLHSIENTNSLRFEEFRSKNQIAEEFKSLLITYSDNTFSIYHQFPQE